MHQCCEFGENPTNAFQDIVLTMFWDAQITNGTKTLWLWLNYNLNGICTACHYN